MFNLHDFVLNTVLGMLGNEPDYKVQEYALGWYNKSVLKDEDMLVISKAIEKKNTVEADEVIEDTEVATEIVKEEE